jgi:hypothetical protein
VGLYGLVPWQKRGGMVVRDDGVAGSMPLEAEPGQQSAAAASQRAGACVCVDPAGGVKH